MTKDKETKQRKHSSGLHTPSIGGDALRRPLRRILLNAVDKKKKKLAERDVVLQCYRMEDPDMKQFQRYNWAAPSIASHTWQTDHMLLKGIPIDELRGTHKDIKIVWYENSQERIGRPN